MADYMYCTKIAKNSRAECFKQESDIASTLVSMLWGIAHLGTEQTIQRRRSNASHGLHVVALDPSPPSVFWKNAKKVR
jgi:hypothetical protein